jgi:hypothetical protein
MDSQMAIKISTHMQMLLWPENLDPRILIDLDLDLLVDLVPINPGKESWDLINDLLQANRSAADL